jgi:hypothetical protein
MTIDLDISLVGRYNADIIVGVFLTISVFFQPKLNSVGAGGNTSLSQSCLM